MKKALIFMATLLIAAASRNLSAQGTAFTYQGLLSSSNNLANGSYDLTFKLFNASSGGSQAGPTLTNLNTGVTNGLFTVAIDFGAQFNSTTYWLEIGVRASGGSGFTTLSPRQELTPAPYSIFAERANAAGLTGTIPTGSLGGTYSGAVTLSNTGNSFAGDGTGLTNVNAATLGGSSSSNFWQLGGNTVGSGQFIGSTNNEVLDFRVDNVRAMRFRLTTDWQAFYSNAPNVILGSSVNGVSTTNVGGTVSGGGAIGSALATPYPNMVSANLGTIGGGAANTASGLFSTVAGGSGNNAGGDTISGSATVGGGSGNNANGNFAIVGGGIDNTASGEFSTVGGGYINTASGQASFAAGTQAQAKHAGSFVWADDYSGALFAFASTTTNQFSVRAVGGVRFVTAIDSGTGAATAGVKLNAGDTSWGTISDRNAKKNFAPVDGEAVLDRLAQVPVERWNYKWEADDSIPHIGPMAQDFKAAFYPGRDDKSITTLEFDGVELAAIQGLNQKLKEKDAEIETLKEGASKVDSLEKRLAELEQAVQALANKK
jgi:hypothetical protein